MRYDNSNIDNNNKNIDTKISNYYNTSLKDIKHIRIYNLEDLF
jgi:hypothetical protein